MNPIKESSSDIFRKGSTTFFNSTKFFPTVIKSKVHTLYAFVRVADNIVDSVHQDEKKFEQFKSELKLALSGTRSNNEIIDNFVEMAKSENIEEAWIWSFMNSMESDLGGNVMETIHDTERYIYGSAEVIGLMMARIMHLPDESFYSAKALGKAFQFINFIRDISEDIILKRQYLPKDLMYKHGLKELNHHEALENPDSYKDFIQLMIYYYKCWQKEAIEGYKYLPHRVRTAVKTAADMYWWTAEKIERDPFIVFEKKVKPSKLRIYLTAFRNLLTF